jgi:hypothetical protein
MSKTHLIKGGKDFLLTVCLSYAAAAMIKDCIISPLWNNDC